MKRITKSLVVGFLISSSLEAASVAAYVDETEVMVGENVTLSLDISGENISKPKIYKICESDVISTSSQTSIEMINGTTKKKDTLSYKFAPQKSCNIEPLSINVDNKVIKTKPIKIEVKPYKVSKDSDFTLNFSSEKKDVYVGEAFDLKLTFKQKNNSQAIDNNFIPPKFSNFWIKNESQPKRYRKNNYIVTEIIYTLAPQKAGLLKVKPAQLQVATRLNGRNSWASWVNNVKWKSYFSNEFSIDVKPLPNGVDIVGDFEISATIDKKSVDENEAVNITVSLDGHGNFEDIGSFKPNIDGVSIFDEKIHTTRNGLTQKMAFVGDKDFTIPPFSLKFFDIKTKKIKTISTQEFKIKVRTTNKPKLEVKRSKVEEKPEEKVLKTNVVYKSGYSSLYLYIAFVVGVVIGFLLSKIKFTELFNKEKNFSIKDEKILLVKLMPYKDDNDVKTIINAIESNIYNKDKVDIDKKLLKECIKRYNIK